MASPAGRRSALTVEMSADDRWLLERWITRHTVDGRKQRRARLLLALADGATITDAARLVGMERRHVYTWIGRWQTDGWSGLDDLRAWNPGRPRRCRPDEA